MNLFFMSSIQDINIRFKESVEKLIDSGDALNKSAIAGVLNIKKSKFSEILNFRMNVSVELISNFCEAYNISLDWMLYDRGDWKKQASGVNEIGQEYFLRRNIEQDIQAIPIYGLDTETSLEDLFESLNENKNKPRGHISLPNLPKCDGSTYMSGDSMYPLLKAGDILAYKIVHNIDAGLFWGETYIISLLVDGEEYVTVNYIQKSDKGEDYVKLVSYNTQHQPKDVHKKSIKALAMVKASVRYNTMR